MVPLSIAFLCRSTCSSVRLHSFCMIATEQGIPKKEYRVSCPVTRHSHVQASRDLSCFLYQLRYKLFFFLRQSYNVTVRDFFRYWMTGEGMDGMPWGHGMLRTSCFICGSRTISSDMVCSFSRRLENTRPGQRPFAAASRSQAVQGDSGQLDRAGEKSSLE